MSAVVEVGPVLIVLVLQDYMAVDDVLGIGKAIEVKFKEDNVNMFNVLSRAGKGKKENSGQPSGGGARKEHGC
ncbi:hypothetical protein A2U01_0034472 [Trifolium medium]|uniref:Uncharacterized protein n=1 Tax=Trifolium medium TaxID=97028 RepID=A0A392PR06_9FABA|nr:hypothetical protein [Trifolium medium]